MKTIKTKDVKHESFRGRFVEFEGDYDVKDGEIFSLHDINYVSSKVHDYIVKENLNYYDNEERIRELMEKNPVILKCEVIYSIDGKVRAEVIQ